MKVKITTMYYVPKRPRLRKVHASVINHGRATVRISEIRLRKRLRIFFKQQAKKLGQLVLSQFGDMFANLPVDARVTETIINALAREDWSEVDATAATLLTAVAVDAAKATSKLLGQHQYADAAVQQATDWATQYLDLAAEKVEKANVKKWSDLKKTTRDMIQNEVDAAIEDGATVSELASALRESAGFSEQRAEVIARTEMAKADSQGALASYRAVPGIAGKSWLVDDDPCEVCMGNADQGGIALDAMFESGDDAAPAHPNCQCAIIPVFADEMDN